MVKNTKAHGQIIKNMVKVFKLGLMVRNIKVNSKMISDQAMEFLNGLMVEFSEDFG